MKPDFSRILQTLCNHQVEFIVVGGICGVLHGAPITTFDLDIVHARSEANVQRLVAALEGLNTYYRDPGGRQLKPLILHLLTPGHHLLMTDAGPLDVLGVIGEQRGFDELYPHTVSLHLTAECTVLVLTLPMLIQTKEETAREKDRFALVILRRTLEEKRKLDK